MLKLQYFGHLMQRANSLEKTLMLGKTNRRRRRGWQRMRWLDGITDSTDMSLRKLREIVKDRKAWRAAVHRITKSWAWISNWTITTRLYILQYKLRNMAEAISFRDACVLSHHPNIINRVRRGKPTGNAGRWGTSGPQPWDPKKTGSKIEYGSMYKAGLGKAGTRVLKEFTLNSILKGGATDSFSGSDAQEALCHRL